MESPFHAGERAAQIKAGVGDVATWAGGFIRDHMPEQHRAFYTSLPFLVLSGADASGSVWVTLVDGPEGFVRSPDPRTLTLATGLDSQDPLHAAFSAGAEVGLIGIELATRRRNRLSGFVGPSAQGFQLDVRQTFGNCPQYIHERAWRREDANMPDKARRSTQLSPDQMAWIKQADTLFIGSGTLNEASGPARGFDASHRGGARGFVQIKSPNHLRIPDYSGNNFFNTIGNLLSDPRIGLVFIDFETGSLLHLSGRAEIDWSLGDARDPDAWRMIDMTIDTVIERPCALALRWARQDAADRVLRVARRVRETEEIMSFYLTPTDGQPLWPFRAGQHLPISVYLPGQTAAQRRTYSLSGSPYDKDTYRLTVKRAPGGQVSGYLHDALREGAEVTASRPSGDFVIPSSDAPLVLVSAGVGLTPMVSMLHAAVTRQSNQRIWFIHGARSGTDHALSPEIEGLLQAHPDAVGQVYYSRPDLHDAPHKTGRITVQDLLNLGAGDGAQYMLCGPAPFLSQLQAGLEQGGVPARNIHFESFGSSDP